MTLAEVVVDVHPPLAVAMALQFTLATPDDVIVLHTTRCGWNDCRLPFIWIECSWTAFCAYLHPVGFVSVKPDGVFIWTECDCLPF